MFNLSVFAAKLRDLPAKGKEVGVEKYDICME
jgi:hypothetical protein